MRTQTIRRELKRMGAAGTAALALHMALPARAAVLQIPGPYIALPPANVMFTLDDSGSMKSDTIPDYFGTTTGMPTNDGSSELRGWGAEFPALWKSGTLYWATTYYQKTSAIARYLRSSAGNPLYYNPAVTYKPWPLASDDTRSNANANPAKVNIDPANPFSTTFTIDLTTRVGTGVADNESNNFWPATYYVYKGTVPLGLGEWNDTNNVAANFDKVEIKPYKTPLAPLIPSTFTKGSGRTDCIAVPSICTYAEELQNFANWLQYYRTRALMAKGGVAAAFAKQGNELRVGFGSINTVNSVKPDIVRQGVAAFLGTRRTNFYTDLYNLPIVGSTPLRYAMDQVGQYFMKSGSGNPWEQIPNPCSGGQDCSCRKSFHILSTDGFWNDAAASGAPAGNNDNFSGTTPPKPGQATGYAYSDTASSNTDPLVGRFTVNPFTDANTGTLADVAAYYWKTDLRPDLPNSVPSSTRDPAFWQHLATYTVGLGVSGTGGVKRTSDGSTKVPASEPTTSPFYPYKGTAWLANQQMLDLLVANKTPLTWTVPSTDSANNGDDVIHAAMNGRGRYFSASDPQTLTNGLSAALAEAADNPGSVANVTPQLPRVSAGSAVYQATYNPSQWAGRLYAFPQAADGSVNTVPGNALWEASNKMPLPASRNIYTWNPALRQGSAFTWAGLTSAQESALGDDSKVLDFLRGSDTNEMAKGGTFRDRSRYTIGNVVGGVLGDIVDGSPIKGPDAGGGYDQMPAGTPGQSSYADYRSPASTTLDNMRNTLFAGANDGMLHAFDSATGVERFAFVPNSVFSVPRSLTGTEQKLQMLTSPSYAHRFTVDGPPQIADAFIGSNAAVAAWKTLLVSSTGAGARSVFAIDITNPVASAGGFDQSKVMWEFSEADNADMGYVTSYPHVARMRNGSWVAIFGNGYDSLNGQAKLFVLDLQTGSVLWQQSVGAAGNNGLSQPNFVVNSNREVTAIYAGDVQGNLWKFDVDNPDPTQWKVAFGSAPNYAPLFAGSANQPITVMPEISLHPSGGALVSFGTGKLFELSDTQNTGVVYLNAQAIYGIWDKPGATAGISGNSTLVQQSMNTGLAAAANLTGTTRSSIDWNTKRGWYMGLQSGGERVIVNPQQIGKVLLVVANKLDGDPCKSGGTSRVFALDPITGSAPTFAVFDANNDGTFTSADLNYNVMSFSDLLSMPVYQRGGSPSSAEGRSSTGNPDDTGRTGANRGGRVLTIPKCPTGGCTINLIVGTSKPGIEKTPMKVGDFGNARISWRQLK